MSEFAFNNIKNAGTDHTLFKLICRCHFCVFYKEDLNSYSKLKTAEKLFSELQNLMVICQQNFYYTQYQKQAYNKEIMP